VLFICTEWNEFRNPDFNKMAKLMKTSVVYDGRNIYSVDAMEQRGFEYHSIGRRIGNPPA